MVDIKHFSSILKHETGQELGTVVKVWLVLCFKRLGKCIISTRDEEPSFLEKKKNYQVKKVNKRSLNLSGFVSGHAKYTQVGKDEYGETFIPIEILLTFLITITD